MYIEISHLNYIAFLDTAFFFSIEGFWQPVSSKCLTANFSNNISFATLFLHHIWWPVQYFRLFHYCYICYHDLWSLILLILQLAEGSVRWLGHLGNKAFLFRYVYFKTCCCTGNRWLYIKYNFHMHWETKKKKWLSLLQCSLYCSGLELYQQYIQCIPVNFRRKTWAWPQNFHNI